MAIALVGSSASGIGDAFVSSIQTAVPAGSEAGDICLLGLEQWETANPVVTPPVGFSPVALLVSGMQKLKVWWKRLSGPDSGNYALNWTGEQWCVAQAITLRGVKASGDPIGDTGSAIAAGTAIPPTTVDTLFAPGLVLFVANENSALQTPPTDFSEHQDSNYLHISTLLEGLVGAYSTIGGSLSNSTLKIALLIALEPEPEPIVIGNDGDWFPFLNLGVSL